MPRGERGVLLKSNGLLSLWLAEMRGLQWEKHNRLSVSLTCGRNLSQSWSGQSMLTVARAATKCSLKVLMACLAALMRCL